MGECPPNCLPNWIGTRNHQKRWVNWSFGSDAKDRSCPSDSSHPPTQFPTSPPISLRKLGLVMVQVNCERGEPSVMPCSKKVLPFFIVVRKFTILFCYLQFNFINHFQMFPEFGDIYALLDLSMLIKKLLV